MHAKSNVVYVYTVPGNHLYGVYLSEAIASDTVEELAEEGTTAFISRYWITRDGEI